MAKRKPKSDNQPALIDVGPKQSKKIAKKAKAYRAVMLERQSILEQEIQLKKELLGLIGEEHLQRTEGGKIQFRVDGMTITVTPRDELVRIKEDSDGDAEEE